MNKAQHKGLMMCLGGTFIGFTFGMMLHDANIPFSYAVVRVLGASAVVFTLGIIYNSMKEFK